MNAGTLFHGTGLFHPPLLSVSTRSFRGARAAAHLARGFFVAAAFRKMAQTTRPGDPLGAWCHELLRLLGVDISFDVRQGPAYNGPCLLVSNHISWMDVCLIRALFPVRFIAKEEVSLWPVVGASARNAGTFFIRRHRLSSFRETFQNVHDSLVRHDSVAVFPEGTTTGGHAVLPFSTGLFEVCTLTGRPVLPVTIRYESPREAPLSAVSYTGGESFARSFWRTLGEPRIVARVFVGPPIFPEKKTRKQLAQKAWEAVARGLDERPVPPAPEPLPLEISRPSGL